MKRVFLTLACACGLLAAAAFEQNKGLLLVRSEPAGATIEVNGLAVGETPRLITTLDAFAEYKIVLRKTGYRDQSFKVFLDGRKPVVRTERLSSASAKIAIATEPAGAAVTVDGIDRGTTPVTLENVSAGEVQVALACPGFKSVSRKLRIAAGTEEKLSVTLEPLPGTLQLNSVPAGARFYLDGRYLPYEHGRLVVTDLKPGPHTVRAELEGYATESRDLTLANGEALSEEFRLSNVMGRIELKTVPARDVRIFLDGRPVGKSHAVSREAEVSDALHLENVLEGDHTLILKADRHRDATRRIHVTNQETLRLGKIILERVLVPDIRFDTPTGRHEGELVRKESDRIVIRERLGVESSYRIDEIRNLEYPIPSR